MSNSKALILTCSPNPEKICAAAAKISTTHGSAIEIYNKTSDDSGKLISKVLKLGHTSVIEHVNFTIAFENVSAFVEQFMIEFRLASFTVKSRRYVDFSNMGFYIPDFRFETSLSERKKQSITEKYVEHMNYLFKSYNDLVEAGVPKEDARFILPYSYKSNFYCTVNARELVNIISSAIYFRGKKFPEIKEIGVSLLEQAKNLCPGIFENIDLLIKGRGDKEERLNELLGQNIRNTSNEVTELISYTNDPEKVVALATILNHSLCSLKVANDLIDSDPTLYKSVLNIACEDIRKRELEQATFTFRIYNITLAGLTHIVRHRMHSINIPSFTEFGRSVNYIIPDTITQNPNLLAKYHELWEKHNQIFGEFEDYGVLKEDLVYMYLSGNVLDIQTTMNARELYIFLKLRTCNRAQWEIRRIAIDMLHKLKDVAPNIFDKVGPSCYMSGECSEGALSCGKIKEVIKYFRGY